MLNEDWDTRRTAALDAAIIPSQTKARAPYFGFCVYGDGPPAIGGGMPWFYWFETKQEMLEFLSEHALFLHSAPKLDLAAIKTAIETKVAGAKDSDLEILRTQLNELLRSSSQFTWIGSFEDLRASDHPEAKKVRSEFRNATPVETGAIHRKDADAFAEFLSSYGV